MTPTFLEIAVAILLLWVAWRLALILTPYVLRRIREWRSAPSRSPQESSDDKVQALHNRKDRNL